MRPTSNKPVDTSKLLWMHEKNITTKLKRKTQVHILNSQKQSGKADPLPIMKSSL